MVSIIQPSFAAGEISPRVQARVDLTKRTVGVERATNALVSVTGSLDKRPGTVYIDTTYANDKGRLIPFVYNREQTYVLVFTDGRLEVYRDGVQKDSLASPYAIADIFDVNYAQYGDQMTLVHPDYAPRELTRNTDTSWSFSTISFVPQQDFPTNVRENENKQTATIQISDCTKANPGVMTSTSAHGLSDNDSIIVSSSVPMEELERGMFKVKVLTSTTFELLDPEDGSDYSTVGYTTWSATNDDVFEAPNPRSYAVTAVNAQTGEESIVGTGTFVEGLASVSAATPAVVTTNEGHGLLTGDEVTFGSTGSILDDERFTVTRLDNLTFSLQWMNGEDVDGSLVSASGGSVRRCFAQAERSEDTKWDNDLYWDKAANAVIYNIYASDGGAFGLIGSTTRRRFRDYFIAPDTSISPPVAFDPFQDPAGTGERNPSAVTYHNQRRIFANTIEEPSRFWMTQAGNFYNLSWSTPAQDDDAIIASIASAQISDIEHLLSLQELLALTTGGEFKLDGSGDPLSPSTITVTPQSFYGAGGLPPLIAGNVGLLHLTGNVIRDFEYNITTQSFVGTDLTILGRHLLDNKTFEDWAYCHTPDAFCFLVTNTDRYNPVFTYFPEQEVFGWARWDMGGVVHSVCSVPEGGFDRLYMIVERDLAGGTTFCIERLALPHDNPYQYHGVDCGVEYEVSGTDISSITVEGDGKIRIVVAGVHGMLTGDTLDIAGVLTVGADGYAEASTEFNGDGFIAEYISPSALYLKDTGGNYIDGSDFATYSSGGSVREAVATVSGLAHLNGETVVAAVNGRAYTGLTVSGGSVTLPQKGTRIHIGLDYHMEVITLPVSSYQQGGTIEGVMKNVNRMALHVISAADFYAGPDKDGLVLYEGKPFTEAKGLYERQELMEKSHLVTIRGRWDRNRSITLQQRSPLPTSIASIIPDALLGET